MGVPHGDLGIHHLKTPLCLSRSYLHPSHWTISIEPHFYFGNTTTHELLTITLLQSTMAIHDLKAPGHGSTSFRFRHFPEKTWELWHDVFRFHGFPWDLPRFFLFFHGTTWVSQAIHLGGASSKKPPWQLEPQQIF